MGDTAAKKIRIRRARATDVTAVYALLVAAADEAGSLFGAYDPDRLMAWALDTIVTGDVWMADLSGRVIGSIGLAHAQFPWAASAHVTTRWLYVLDKFRARGAGTALLNAVVRATQAQAAPLVIGAQSAHGQDWKDEILGRVDGAVYVGASFIRPAGPA